ncbi:hypothetical protein M0Q97_00905 [Candidatus Dojkabacteria bacterium]|nr:hypothetical protein [Candidatus Dojkabacteria bacterium]
MTTTTHSCTILSMATNSKQRLTLFINPDVIKQAKVQAILEESTLTAFIEEAVLAYLPKEIVIKKPGNR